MSFPIVEFDPEVSQSLLHEVMEQSGQNLQACYQCRRCAAGCPVGEETGVPPDRLIRMILLGEKEEVLNNQLVWKCLACYTCGTRCPNGIQTAKITETLKQMCKQAGLAPAAPKIDAFHHSFMSATSHFGRFNELEFMGLYEMENTREAIKRGDWKAIAKEMKDQAKLGLTMIKKKRMHMGLEKVKKMSEVKGLYNKAKARSKDRWAGPVK